MARFPFILAAVVLFLPAQGSADTINGCVKQKSGKLRIVGDPGQCTSKEAPVSWESEGPQCEPPPAPPRFELVGFTNATFDGDEGYIGFTLACQGEFPGSRMCSITEIIQTVDFPSGLTGRAWVRPGTSFSRDDTCGRWRAQSAGTTGMSVDPIGYFEQFDCDNTFSVACCAPAP